MSRPIEALVQNIKCDLLPNLKVASVNPRDPVKVYTLPSPWETVGTGNYAAVFSHPRFPDLVVKVYAPGRAGIEAEIEVYQHLGEHPGFSHCLYAEIPFLILKRIDGITLYDCIHTGVFIPEQVILDIDAALEYAQERGLRPHDVHGRNVMLSNGRGVVVDVSDFLHPGSIARSWIDLRWAYYAIYQPIIARFSWRIPYGLLNLVRKSYHWSRKYCRWLRK